MSVTPVSSHEHGPTSGFTSPRALDPHGRGVHLAVLAGYALLTVVMTWPLARQGDHGHPRRQLRRLAELLESVVDEAGAGGPCAEPAGDRHALRPHGVQPLSLEPATTQPSGARCKLAAVPPCPC
ncbi:MAG: hypothetical protein R3A10_14150 [Caldilineaceae bacterium]